MVNQHQRLKNVARGKLFRRAWRNQMQPGIPLHQERVVVAQLLDVTIYELDSEVCGIVMQRFAKPFNRCWHLAARYRTGSGKRPDHVTLRQTTIRSLPLAVL